ncbi:MAG: hypothetical protein QM683_07345 [Lacrimispora sp.]
METFTPKVKAHPLYDDTVTVAGMSVEFDYGKDTVAIDGHEFSLSECGFTAAPFSGLVCTALRRTAQAVLFVTKDRTIPEK